MKLAGSNSKKTTSAEVGLTQAELRWLIKKWNGVKSKAMGQEHDAGGLRDSLAGALLDEWKERAAAARRERVYWQYDLVGFEVLEIAGDVSGEIVTAKAKIQENGQLLEKRGGRVRAKYSDPYLVTYSFKKTDAGWKIVAIKI